MSLVSYEASGFFVIRDLYELSIFLERGGAMVRWENGDRWGKFCVIRGLVAVCDGRRNDNMIDILLNV